MKLRHAALPSSHRESGWRHNSGYQALKEMNFKLISNFFLTTFPTNMCLACRFGGRNRNNGADGTSK